MPGKGRSDPDEDRSRPPALKDGQLKLVDWTLATLPVWWDEHVPRLSGSLTMLNLKSNLFKATPDLRSLQRLVELNLNGNELTALDATGLPPSLLRLHAVNNKIVHVERGLLNALPRLNRLDLTGNHLTKDGLASAMAGLSTNCSLEALDISCNHLQQLPPGVLEASSLLELRVNMNPLSACPPLSALCSLVFLGLARCGLSTLASEVVTGLPRLTTLDVARNRLTKLPAPSPKSELTRLFASFNSLPSIEPALLRLRLVELDLSHNRLSAWPDGLGDGGILERILLSHNRIASLPPAASRVASSEGLREFHLDHNCIAEVRDVTIECCDFTLTRNPLDRKSVV